MTLLPILVTALLAADPLEAGDHLRKLDVDGVSRSFLVHVPANYDPQQPTPVVLVFHGTAMNARMMATYSGMSQKADEAGFIAVYPNGTGPTKLNLFFDGGGLPEPEEGKTRADDVVFTTRLLDDLEAVLAVDRHRIFAAGFSNGGMMCYRLAAEMSGRIAAIASVAGPIAIDSYKPRRPVPVIHFHGTADTIVTWEGPSETIATLQTFKPVDESIRLTVLANRCQPTLATEELPDLVDDGTTVVRQFYKPQTRGAEVVLYKIIGGGHTWPGHASLDRLLGKSCQDISANDLIWEFFSNHPLPEEGGRSLAVAHRLSLPAHVTRRVVQEYRFALHKSLSGDTRQFPAARPKAP